MSSDKRTVATDALETLGTIIGEGEKRDAIHLAVEPIIAAEDLMPGQDVGFVEGGAGRSDNPVGIVDPFLKDRVQKGQRFWLVVYPRQITSLRHVWEHPAFPADEAAVSSSSSSRHAAEDWLRAFAEKCAAEYYEMMGRVEEFCKYPDTDDDALYASFDIYGEIPPEFWTHFEIVTGLTPKGKRPTHFVCGC